MEGFCRGCLVKYDEPTDLIPYSEKNRRLFIYSTGLQVKRNDTFTFQLCKECYLNMKQSCIFKKQCRNSEKKLKNYMSLKEDGDAIDFSSYIKNCEDLLTIRLPLASGNSTPAHQKTKDDDNESTCTSIRNFMSDILQGQEVPDTEARIIRELIEEEADVLDDSLDSHWLQDDMSIGTDFRMDFSFSPFSTPRSIQNDHCYTPKRLNDEKDDYFTQQIEKPPDEKYHMPILDDCEIDIDQPANIPMYEIKTESYTEKESKNYEINNFKLDKIECDSYTTMESQNYKVKNAKLSEMESQNYEINNLELKETERQNYEVNNTVKINVNSKSEQEIYFVEQITAIEPNKIVEDDFLDIGEKTQDFIAATEIENDFYNITNNSNQQKVGKEIGESSLLNNELEYYINKAELKKKCTVVDNNKCLIDRNLEKALENEDNKEIPLDILLSSPKVDIRSGASTPTIRNILFGDTLLGSNDSPKLGQCIEKYHPIEGQTNILDDFLKDDDNINIGHVKMKEETVSDYNLTSLNQVRNKVEILEVKVIKEKDKEKHKFIEGDLINKEEKSEDIRDLIEDYVTNVYDKITEQDVTDEEIDALELLKATNTTLDDSIFKKPSSPLYDKYDLENSHCKICDKNFKTQINLKIHFAKKHKFKIVNNIPKLYHLRVEICDICGQTVKGKANLNRHKRIAHGDAFFCEECLLQFPTQHGLNIHRRSHKENLIKSSSKVYDQICNICSKRVSKANHKLHLLRHLKDFKFKCEICDKGFYRQGDYEIHLRSHTNSRPFKCKICPKSYKRRASLKIHNKQHLEKQEFICNICSSRFTSKRMLKNHFRTKLCKPANKASDEQCNPTNKASLEPSNPAINKISDVECSPVNKSSDEQCNPADKASDVECKPTNKASLEQSNPAIIKTSDVECSPVNKSSDEKCNPADKASDAECKPTNKASDEQCNPTNKASLEQSNSAINKTSDVECSPVNKSSDEQCNPADKTSDEQCNPTYKTSDEQCNPTNKALVEQSNPTINKTSEIITEETEKTEQIITEEIEFTVKFSPVSVKEDERSDPLLD